MNKKHKHNPKLIMTVKEVEVVQTRSNPPRTLVVARGEARTNASNVRLEVRDKPSIPEALQLDFEADEGLLPVITPVTAVYEIGEGHGFNEVTVHAETNSISREVPPGFESTRAMLALELHIDSTQTPMGICTSLGGGDSFTFRNNHSSQVTVVVYKGGTESPDLFKDKDGNGLSRFTLNSGATATMTVKSHATDTDYTIGVLELVAGDKNTVKGYIKVKGTHSASAR